jgi:acetylornithine deacetylase/succinyl-diaminopimelate desuccinylase-like protein
VGFYPPCDPADYAAYVRAVVHRYKGTVHVWEISNEENIAAFWRPVPNASAYAALLEAAYAAIKAEDPTATVLIGGLAASDLGFLEQGRAAGAWNSFDAVAIHTCVNGAPDVSVVS